MEAEGHSGETVSPNNISEPRIHLGLKFPESDAPSSKLIQSLLGRICFALYFLLFFDTPNLSLTNMQPL